MILSVEKLLVKYGTNIAVDQIDIQVDKGEVVCILGANGAGKSSLLRALLGHTKSSGIVKFKDNDVSSHSATQRVRDGLVLVPEGRKILTSLSVEENLLMGAHLRYDKDIYTDIKKVYEMFPNL